MSIWEQLKSAFTQHTRNKYQEQLNRQRGHYDQITGYRYHIPEEETNIVWNSVSIDPKAEPLEIEMCVIKEEGLSAYQEANRRAAENLKLLSKVVEKKTDERRRASK